MPLPVVAGLSSIALRVGGSAGRLVLQSFIGGVGGISTKVKWNGPHVQKSIRAGMTKRINLAAQMTRDQVVRNVRRPVTKIKKANFNFERDLLSQAKIMEAVRLSSKKKKFIHLEEIC